jgi:hypothetical protein
MWIPMKPPRFGFEAPVQFAGQPLCRTTDSVFAKPRTVSLFARPRTLPNSKLNSGLSSLRSSS